MMKDRTKKQIKQISLLLLIAGFFILVLILGVVGQEQAFNAGSYFSGLGEGGSEKLYYTPKTEGDTSGSDKPGEWHIGKKTEKDQPVPEQNILNNLETLSKSFTGLWKDEEWRHQQIDKVNEHFKTNKFTYKSDLTGYEINGDKLKDPAGREHDISKLKDNKDVKSITTTPEGIYLEDSKGGLHFIEKGSLEIKPIQGLGEDAAAAELARRQAEAAHQGDGGSSDGGDGKGLTPEIDQALQAALQAWSQISGILGQLKEALKPAGDSKTSSSGSNSQIALDKGAEAYVEDQKKKEDEAKKEALLSQENKDGKESVTTINQDLTKLSSSSNTEVVIPKQVVVHVPEDSSTTDIENKGKKSDPYSVKSLINSQANAQDSGVGSIVPFSGGVTGLAISGSNPNQFVKLLNHNLEIGGQTLIVDLLKSFNEVDVEGNNLVIYNGETNIEFYDMKTFYPRRIKQTPHNLLTIKNKLDTSNYFKLRNYEDENNYLVDGNKIVSVGNRAVPHPKIKGLKIAEIREEMWES